MDVRPGLDIITAPLRAEARVNLADLIAYLAGLKLSPRWYATNAMNVKYKGRIVLRFTVVGDSVHLYFTLANPCDLDSLLASLSQEDRDFFLSNLRYCTNCNPKHAGGRKMTILGKDVDVCAEPELKFIDPQADQITTLKRLILLRRNNIQKNAKETFQAQ